jgi:hypothetical protein
MRAAGARNKEIIKESRHMLGAGSVVPELVEGRPAATRKEPDGNSAGITWIKKDWRD